MPGFISDSPLARALIRIGDEAIVREDDVKLRAYYADDYVFHEPGGDLGFDELRAYFASLRAAFSRLHIVREQIIVDHNFLAARTTFAGDFTSVFTDSLIGPVQPTGQRLEWEVINTLRYDDGRLAEEWVQTDHRGFLTEIGVTTKESVRPGVPDASDAAETGRRLPDTVERAPLVTPVDAPDVRPLLGESQMTTLLRYGEESAVRRGEALFSDGDVSYDLIVILEGRVDIVEHFGNADERVIISYGPREFLGEKGLLTGQRVFLTAVATTDGRVVRVPAERVRTVMAEEAELSDYLLRAFLLRHVRLTQMGVGLTLIGSRFDRKTRRMLDALARNRLSFRWLELEGMPEAEETLRQLAVSPADLPLVVAPGGVLLFDPSDHELLVALGLTAAPSADYSVGACDLLVVGGGPAGLAASVYGASEGLTTVVVENTAIGGQAGTSSRIENYLGFPAGLSGEELAARAALQANKFGVRMRLGAGAISMSSEGGVHRVCLDDGEAIAARAVIIATGARYNRLSVERLADFEGVGVYYAATQMEAQACSGGPVIIVGGGNSAGQAALFLARACTEVRIVIRADSLSHSMSRYLIDEIDREPRISLSVQTEVVGLIGEQGLEGVTLRDNRSGDIVMQASCGLFVFIGATPCTQWLSGQLAADEHGFLLTGGDIPSGALEHAGLQPLLLETSRPGVFCVGDARSRSIKRVATAIGEGSMAVRLVFDRLAASGLAAGD